MPHNLLYIHLPMQNPEKTPDKIPPVFLPENDFRADLIPGSQAMPDRSLFRERLAFFTPARAISLGAVLGLVIFGWILSLVRENQLWKNF